MCCWIRLDGPEKEVPPFRTFLNTVVSIVDIRQELLAENNVEVDKGRLRKNSR
jgi:hypothetical protein